MVSNDPLTWFQKGIASVSPQERTLLTVLALAEPLNISRFTELANLVRIVETPTRKMSTAVLRARLAPLEARSLIVFDEGHYSCAPLVRHQALRLAARQGDLAPLARIVGARGEGSLAFAARVALASGDATAVTHLQALIDAKIPHLALTIVHGALTQPFDPTWFSQLSSPFRTALLGLALPWAEVVGLPLAGLYTHLSATLETSPWSEEALSALGGIAVLRGDIALVKRIATRLGPSEHAARALLGAAAVVEGDHDRALELFSVSPKRSTPHAGVVGVLHVLSLVHRGHHEDLVRAQRLASAGARKGNRFAETFLALRDLVKGAANATGEAFPDIFHHGSATLDCLGPWMRLLVILWMKCPEYVWTAALTRAVEAIAHALEHDLGWLAAETHAAATLVAAKLPPTKRPANLATFAGRLPAQRGKPFASLRAEKATWEIALEGIERLATAGAPAAEAPSSHAERIIWRVAPRSFQIEPFLQKRTGRTWSSGRKVALKHLLPGGQHRKELPPEDERIALCVREEHTRSYGYTQVDHSIEPRAWTLLVGHPRVFVYGADDPIEVVRGSVQLVANTRDGALVLAVDPPDLQKAIDVRQEGGRLLVYSLDKPQQMLVKLVGQGLTIPATAKSRALETLRKIAHVAPVHTSEQTAAKSVPADPLPWIRLVPHGSGLSAGITVRPLGGEGPHLTPGRGSVTLIGRLKGESVQTLRDLAEERHAAQTVIDGCSVLEGRQSADDGWTLTEPGECLELVSALHVLGSSVHVEWPQGKPLRLRARVGRRALRGALRRGKEFFFASGTVAIDSELSINLDDLLALVAESPSRFVHLSSGEYLELEQDLRDVLDALEAARAESNGALGKDAGIALPASALSVLERLSEDDAGFSLDRETQAWRTRFVKAFEKRFSIPRALQAELRGYQADGFRWLARLAEIGLGGCLADDMGLGKTVQIIALFLHRAKTGPALVVAPTSVCDNWSKEIARFAPSLKVRSFAGAERARHLEKLGAGDVVITSYALLQQDIEVLEGIEWGTAVLDEAQLVKNADTLRAKAAYRLRAPVRIASTGTPVENQVGDLYGIFRFVMPDLLGSWTRFSRRFNGMGEADGAGRRALKRLLQPFVLRRTKAQVLDDLPPMTEIQHTVTLSAAEAELYEAVRRTALEKLSGAAKDPRSGIQVLAEITRLRRLCCHPALVLPNTTVGSSKLESFMELLEELVENRHRAIVFSQFVDVLGLARKMLEAKGISYQYLDGSTPPKQRTIAVEAFQAGEGDAFLISLKAGGFGLNLTGADYVIHLDPWWNPAVESQASDRTHRIGQTRPVTVYRLVTAGTVEARIVELHASKRELADSLLEDTNRTATLSTDELRALLEG